MRMVPGTRHGKLAVVLLVAIGGVAAAGSAGLLSSGQPANRALAAPGPAGTTNVQVSLDDPPGSDQSEATIAACGGTIVAAWNDNDFPFVSGPEDLQVGHGYSTNGGASWTDGGNTANPPGRWDPALAADGGCNFYLATGYDGPAENDQYIGVAKSTDGGQTFGAPVQAGAGLNSDFQDKPWIAADATGGTHDGNVYLCWGAYGLLVDQLFTRSTNGGVSFEAARSLASPQQLNMNMCQVAVGPQGEVYVAWVAAAPFSIRVRRSDDGGVSFGPERVVAVAQPPGHLAKCGWMVKNGAVRVPATISLAVDPVDGRLYAVWTDGGSDEGDILVARSTNRGDSWSAPLRVNDDVTTRDQFLPAVAVNPDGVVQIMWYDRRLDAANLAIDVFTSQSVDGGKTFGANERVTDVSFGLTPYLDPSVNCYMGDYNSLVGTAGAFNLVWGDNRNLDGDGLAQTDIFSAAIAVPTTLPATATQPATVTPTLTATPKPTPAILDTAAIDLQAPSDTTLDISTGPVTFPVSLTVQNQGNRPKGDTSVTGDGVVSLLALLGLPDGCLQQPGINYYNIVATDVRDLAPGAQATSIDIMVEIDCNDWVPSGHAWLTWIGWASAPQHGDLPTLSMDDDPVDNVIGVAQNLHVYNPAIPFGDASCNGAAESIDALLVLQFGVGLLGALDCYPSADINGDGDADALDALLILQYVAGFLDQLPP